MGNFADLFGPNESYAYFKFADRNPFEVRSTHFSLVNAGWLADCALLVYLREETQVQERLERAGLHGVCFGFDCPGAQGFVGNADDWALVCFRGTEVEEWQDIVADVWIKLVSKSEHAGRVHAGFYRALGSIWPGIEDELERIQKDRQIPIPVWFTGHSLGAAMATLAGDRYDGAHALYTFGSPRVGDKAFRQGLAVNAYRIVNNNDGVTTVPPGPPLSSYRHVGDLKYLGDGGELIDDPGWWTVLKASLSGHRKAIQDAMGDLRRGDLDEVNVDQLRDHSPTAYANTIWQIIGARGA